MPACFASSSHLSFFFLTNYTLILVYAAYWTRQTLKWILFFQYVYCHNLYDSYWQELERLLAAKEASLPEEPGSDDENAVTLLVRMPNGIRRGRRFLKSDKLQVCYLEEWLFCSITWLVTKHALLFALQFLFDFIDIGRGVKPGTYRLVSTLLVTISSDLWVNPYAPTDYYTL